MDKKIEKQILEEYKKGKSSIEIVKIVNLSKPTILKILHKYGIVRKRNRCEKLDYTFDGENYIVYRKCPSCGNLIPTKSKDKTIACRNHINKINSNIDCKKCSLEKQKGEGNPFYGKKHKVTTKNNISKSRKGKGVGKENSMSNPKHKERAIKNLKQKWENGEMEHVRKIMSDTMKNTIRTGKIKPINKSKAEGEIKILVEMLGYNVIDSYKIDTKVCDLYIPNLNLIIEYNGDYWHCNPIKYPKNYYNRKKSMFAWEIWDYDKSKVDLIKSYNYNLEVIWETDFKSNKDIIKNLIKKYE